MVGFLGDDAAAGDADEEGDDEEFNDGEEAAAEVEAEGAADKAEQLGEALK